MKVRITIRFTNDSPPYGEGAFYWSCPGIFRDLMLDLMQRINRIMPDDSELHMEELP